MLKPHFIMEPQSPAYPAHTAAPVLRTSPGVLPWRVPSFKSRTSYSILWVTHQ